MFRWRRPSAARSFWSTCRVTPIIDAYNDNSILGDVREVLCEGWSEEAQSYVGRSYAESVDIDGKICTFRRT